MGLDMYLNKGKRIPKKNSDEFMSYEEMRKIDDLISNEGNEDIAELYKDYVYDCGEYLHWKSLTKEILYWRKANAIHKWFVDNVQLGEDNCGYYEVTKEQLMELRDKCIDVIRVAKVGMGKVSNGYSYVRDGNELKRVDYFEDGEVVLNAEDVAKILPSSSGFFFGSTDYDMYYIEQVKYTLAELNKILKETNFEKDYVEYHSSW